MSTETETMDKSDVARALAAMRRHVESTCIVCGAPIAGVVQRRYCGINCRQRAAQRRKRAALRQTTAAVSDSTPSTPEGPGIAS